MRVLSQRGRLATAAAIGSMALVLAGCGGSSSDEGEPEGTDPAANTTELGEPNPAEGEPVKLGVLGQDPVSSDEAIKGFEATTEFINEYRGGLNGRPIELVKCSAEEQPAKATACGVEFAKEKVVAVMTGTNGQALPVFKALDGTDIPFIVQLVADVDILSSENAFVMSNATGLTSASLAIAEENDVKSASIIVIDVPGAVAPVKAIAEPLYEGAGIEFDLTPISAQVADPTPQVQQALSAGVDQFTVFGQAGFVSNVIRSLKTLGFDGPIITQVTNFPADQVEGIPGGLEGVNTIGSISQSEENEDRQLFNTVLQEYLGDAELLESEFTQSSFQLELALVDALFLSPDAGGDAKSVKKALSSMSRPVILPISGGMTFQCGAGISPVLPAVCVGSVLKATLGEDGQPVEEEVIKQ